MRTAVAMSFGLLACQPAVALLEFLQVAVKLGAPRQELCRLCFGLGYFTFQIVHLTVGYGRCRSAGIAPSLSLSALEGNNCLLRFKLYHYQRHYVNGLGHNIVTVSHLIAVELGLIICVSSTSLGCG